MSLCMHACRLLLLSHVAVHATQVSWQVLSLSQLNAELRCPVTAAEVQAQHLAEKGQLSNDNAASLLPPFAVDLGVAAAGGGPRQFCLEVSNDGVLPAEWELHSYDAPQVSSFMCSSSRRFLGTDCCATCGTKPG